MANSSQKQTRSNGFLEALKSFESASQRLASFHKELLESDKNARDFQALQRDVKLKEEKARAELTEKEVLIAEKDRELAAVSQKMVAIEEAHKINVEKFSTLITQRNNTIAQMDKCLETEKRRGQQVGSQARIAAEKELAAARLRSSQLEKQLQEATVQSNGLAVELSRTKERHQEMMTATGLLEEIDGM